MIDNYEKFINYINVSRETYDKFCLYNDILAKWQKKMNLVSNSSLKESMLRHFIDSGQLFKFFINLSGNVVDFGSGAGFPGMVLAIMGIKNMYLIESNRNKCKFLKEISKQTSTKVFICNERFENFNYVKPSFIISRAVASTSDLLEICFKYCDVKDIIKDKNKIPNLLFLKGKNYKSELDNIANNRKIKFEISNSISGGEGKILYYKANRKNV